MNENIEEIVEKIIDIVGYDGFGHIETNAQICSSFYSQRGHKYILHGENNYPCDCGTEERKEQLRTTLLTYRNKGWEELRERFADHYWDTLNGEKEIIMLHVDALLGTNPPPTSVEGESAVEKGTKL